MYPFRRILVATEFDASSAGALDLGSGLAREYVADLVIAHAVEIFVPPYPIAVMPELSSIERSTRQGLDTIVARVEAVWPRVTGVLLWGSPAEQIVRYAEEHAMDLVVVGTHGRRGGRPGPFPGARRSRRARRSETLAYLRSQTSGFPHFQGRSFRHSFRTRLGMIIVCGPSKEAHDPHDVVVSTQTRFRGG